MKLVDGEDLLLEKLSESTIGEYEIRGLLGRGGMASVFVAYDLTLNRKVALKVMHPGLLGDSGMRERFRLEARLSARLDHPNIVTVHAVKERGNIVFFDLKLIEGTSLDRLVRHHNRPFSPKLARWITAKIADALHYAHGEAVVHRDVKPANVMVDRRGDLIVTDFGIAKAAESPHLTMTGAVVGTPAYMSPEQCLGTEVTAASDQYSLGILAYELLTGAVPFTGSMLTIQLGHVEKVPPPPHTIVGDVPKQASDAVMRMLEKAPADRWATLADAAEALLDSLGSSDAQMRKELAVLLAGVPEDPSRSLPPTPRSPTPATMPHDVGTQAINQTARMHDAATEELPTPVPPPTRRTGAFQRGKRVAPLIGIAVVTVAIVTTIALSGGHKGGAATAAVDSSATARADTSLNSALDASDTLVARVGVNPVGPVLSVGDSLQLKALVFGPSGETIKPKNPVRWSSDDSTVVRVSRDGWIRALARTKAGPVFITAEAGKKSGVATVTVK